LYLREAEEDRVGDILRGQKLFRCVIPSDQFDELVQAGKVSRDGVPSVEFGNQIFKQAVKQSKVSGEPGQRLAKVIPDAKKIISKVKVNEARSVILSWMTRRRLAPAVCGH